MTFESGKQAIRKILFMQKRKRFAKDFFRKSLKNNNLNLNLRDIQDPSGWGIRTSVGVGKHRLA
jgi:hypothetical protein